MTKVFSFLYMISTALVTSATHCRILSGMSVKYVCNFSLVDSMLLKMSLACSVSAFLIGQ